jgi:exodeoxyribonuclease III
VSQELKAAQDKFPARALQQAGYGAIWHGRKSWNGVAILARGVEPTETRRELPGEPDAQSRYIEAAVKGVLVGCLYVPNGNPAPGPKFDYKLRWYQRLIAMRPSRSQSTRRSCWRVKARADMVSTNARTSVENGCAWSR